MRKVRFRRLQHGGALLRCIMLADQHGSVVVA